MRFTAWLTVLGMASTLGITGLLGGCGDSGTGSTPKPPESGGTTATPPDNTGSTGGGGRTQIAIIPPTTGGNFWKAVHAGALKAQQETIRKPGSKPTIDILWREPTADNDSASQIKTVESALADKVAAIIIVPADPSALNPVIDQAKTKKISVVILGSSVTSDAFKSFITTDYKPTGNLAGGELAKLLSGKGKVIVAGANADSIAGFTSAMQTNSTIGSVTLASPDASALTAADGLFATDEASTTTLLPLHGKLKFVGTGASEKLTTALSTGEIDALVLQDSFNMGYTAMKTAIDCIKEKKVEKRIEIPARLATKENIDTLEIKEILNPNLEPAESK